MFVCANIGDIVAYFYAFSSPHQYSHETLFGTCTMLHNVVQLLQVSKLQTKPAMSRFQQVAASELFHDLL
jgi:hypothetical protein